MAQTQSNRVGILWSKESVNESTSVEESKPSRHDGGGASVYLAVLVMAITAALVISFCLASIPIHKAKILTPDLPYVVYGYTFDEHGSKLSSCALKILDRNSMNSSITTSDSGGWYQFDLSSLPGGYQTGDAIWLLGNKTTEIGLNRTSVTGSGGIWMNLTLSAHTPIRIDSNSDFDAMHGVSGGSGTPIDPYIIENRDISGNGIGYCIGIGNTTDSFIVRNCRLHDAWLTYATDHGLTLFNVSNARIWNNTVFSNQYYGIFVYSSNNNTISNNTAFGNIYGIVLQYSSSNAISNNSVHNNRLVGISLDVSNNNEITNNIATSDCTAEIDLWGSSSGNRIAKNTLTASTYGIRSGSSQYNTISNNNMFSNAYGIYLSSSSNNINVTDNNCSHNTQAIYLASSSSNTLSNNTCNSNTQIGIYLEGGSNTLSNNTCSYNTGVGIYVGGLSNVLSKNTCSHNYGHGMYVAGSTNAMSNNICLHNAQHGMYLYGANSNTLSNNTCSNNTGAGMNLYPASSNTLTNNTCSGNANSGIAIGDSTSNTIIDNIISDNLDGIALVSSTNIVLKGNTLVNDGLNIYTSQQNLGHWNSHNIDASNTVNGKPLYYYKNTNGGVVPAGAGQVVLANCQNMAVENQHLDRANIGIALGFSWNNRILNNSCSGNSIYDIYLDCSSSNTIADNSLNGVGPAGYGITLTYSSSNALNRNNCSNHAGAGMGFYYSSNANTISGNILYHNGLYGVHVYSSSNNRIWNNTFLNNNGAGSMYSPSHIQARDDGTNNWWNSSGTPHGYGNYWSDWTRPDANRDLIVDLPYLLSPNQDNYPRTWASNFTLHLLAGWNFVSIPLVDFTYNASTLGLSAGDMVCAWDPATQHYSNNYIVGISPRSQDFKIKSSAGYWVWVMSEEDLTLVGIHPDKYSSYSIPLNVPVGGGWVSIGLSSFDSSVRASDLASYVSGSHAKLVCKYDATTHRYLSYVVGFSPPAYNFDILPGDAMWLWVDGPGGTLTYSP